ncbi:hypothetical protein L1049_015593 [Liquidambar formosana]|uniref:Uncharacterized protein n=1 Tax=Liquidambar formosana TaxID=63359 RepID=A0AAP0X1Z7_LIQFO
MEECMRDSMRKLALWYTRQFKPIMTHEELDPIMATLGFVSSSPPKGGGWKEYVYSAGGWRRESTAEPLPRPRLPYPRIDGLHIYTYRAFIDAVNFYLEMSDISDLFHIRGMPLHRIHDRSKKWRRMEEDDSVFVYREGTLDQATYNFYHFNKNSVIGEAHNSILIHKQSNDAPISCLVPWKDTII